jgi:hypothetical protein
VEHGGAEILLSLVVEGYKASHRQAARDVRAAVEKGQLPSPMRMIAGLVKIDGDQPGAMVQPLRMTFDHALGQRCTQSG